MDPEEDIIDEELKDSGKTTEGEEDLTPEDEIDLTADGNAEEEDDKDDPKPKSYRPSEGEKVKKEDKETVPLKKYLEVKKDLKKLLSEKESPLNKQTLEEFAEEAGMSLEKVNAFAQIILTQATSAASKVADERIAPIIQEKISRTNQELFDADFEKSIATKYPELASKKEAFQKIAFSKDFLHLKSLEEIKNEFYPDVKPTATKVVKKATPEKGSIGGGKETERIQFKDLRNNPVQYEKVMKDPIARQKYFDWQDSNE